MLLNEKNSIPLTIRIHPVDHRPGYFAAMYKTDFTQATYIVCFRDDITGAIAFKAFTEMLERYYNKTVVIDLKQDNPISFKSRAILDFITSRKQNNKGEQNGLHT